MTTLPRASVAPEQTQLKTFRQRQNAILKHVFETKTGKVSTNADMKLPVTQDLKEIQRSDNHKKYQEYKKDDKNKYFMSKHLICTHKAHPINMLIWQITSTMCLLCIIQKYSKIKLFF